MPLTVWWGAAWLICLGESARRCARETGVRYARAYALLWRMIEAALNLKADRKLSGEVEADEIYIRSGHKGQHSSAGEPSGEPSERHSRRRGLRHGPSRGHADKHRPVIFVQLQRGRAGGTGPLVNLEAAAGVDQETVKRVFT